MGDDLPNSETGQEKPAADKPMKAKAEAKKKAADARKRAHEEKEKAKEGATPDSKWAPLKEVGETKASTEMADYGSDDLGELD